MYTDEHKAAGAKTLPLNLLDALRALERSTDRLAAFGHLLRGHVLADLSA